MRYPISDEKNIQHPFPQAGIGCFKERLREVKSTQSLRGFSSKCGISEATLRSYLAGETYPTLDRLVQIAEAAQVDPAWLAVGSGDKTLMRDEAHQEGGYRQEADDFVYIEELATADEGIVSTRHAVRRDWLMARGLEPARLRFLETREDAMAPTIRPGDRLLCETYFHKEEGCLKTGLAPGELPPEGGLYVLRLGDKGPTALRRLRLDMGGGLVLSADADQSLHLHLLGEDQLRRTHILARAVALWRAL